MDPQDHASQDWPLVALPPLPLAQGWDRWSLLPGTLARLGPRALLAYARHRLAASRALPADRVVPRGPFLHATSGPDPAINWFGPVPAADRTRQALSVPTGGTFDIRQVWEAGRCVDLPARAAQDPAAAEATVRSFVAANPPFRGPHWACGQEASIRLTHLLLAWQAVGGPMLPGLRDLVVLHRERILATLDYAMAQDNNHAISEAVGLCIAGIALEEHETIDRGRRLLQRATQRLFAASGAFSQHSMRYHVVALDMMALADVLARGMGAPGLSAKEIELLRAAAAWLQRIADPATGLAWRVGHDDSSRFLDASPDDLRPTLARAASVLPPVPAPPPSEPFWLDAEGGFAGLAEDTSRAFLRLPCGNFRPSQADALHLDVWHQGTCLLGDAGTATYNFRAFPEAPDLSRTAAHNTVAFDDDDQMPKLSRFLYAAWLSPVAIEARPGHLRAAYRDWKGRRHDRVVALEAGRVAVTDTVAGRFRRGVLRWRLPDGRATLDGDTLHAAGFMLRMAGAAGLRLVRLPYAPHYGAWRSTPALEAWLDHPGTLTTTIMLE